MKIANLQQTPISNASVSKNKIAFKGTFLNDLRHPSELLNLDRSGTMSRNLFIVNAFVFLLGSRLFTSRDKDEKREILIRDVPSIVLAVIGVPFFKKIIAKGLQLQTGFVINEKKDGKPAKGDSTTYSRLEDLYVYDKNLDKSVGLKGFSDRLSSFGGDLKKIYSELSGEIKEQLKDCGDKNNTEVINKIKDKGLAEKIKEALTDAKNNKALKKAETYNSAVAMTGFACTIALMGFIIPKLNIHVTEKVHKNDNENQNIKDGIEA